MNKEDVTVVICCAGMGTRLGIGTPKTLVNIGGKPLIIHILDMLKDYDDIRIVVGFQADKVINVVKEYRKDISFAFNYDYETTGVASSFLKGAVGARKYIVSIDGDLLVNPDDFATFMSLSIECIAGSTPTSEETIYLVTDVNKEVIDFSQRSTSVEWIGLIKIKSSRLAQSKDSLIEMMKQYLPLPLVKVRSREIDTSDDYDKTVQWFRDGCID